MSFDMHEFLMKMDWRKTCFYQAYAEAKAGDHLTEEDFHKRVEALESCERCVKCGRPIEDNHREDVTGHYHRKCWTPDCAWCRQPIIGSIHESDGLYHSECFHSPERWEQLRQQRRARYAASPVQDELPRLREERDDLKVALKITKEELDKARRRNRDLLQYQRKIDELEKNLEDLRKLYNRCEMERGRAASRVQELDTECFALKSRGPGAALRFRNADLERKMVGMEETIVAIQGERDHAREERNEAVRQRGRLLEENANIARKRKDGLETIDRLRRERDEANENRSSHE